MKTLAKYLAFVRMGAVRGVTERGELYGRMLFFPIILGVFNALWTAVGEAGMPTTGAPHDLVWYLAATEWIALSAPLVYVEIQEDVRRGDIACHLPRPVSYLGATFCQGLGLLAVRALVLGLIAWVSAFVFTGQLPRTAALLSVIPFGFSAAALIVASYMLMGLLAFWLVDITPVYWVWQKALFLLGGLMLPLELYPLWMQQIGAWTPFPALLAGPGGLLLSHFSLSYALLLAARLSLWALVLAAALHLVFRRATRRLQLSGG
jgi:ABC-2 type transport system permease protein